MLKYIEKGSDVLERESKSRRGQYKVPKIDSLTEERRASVGYEFLDSRQLH
jgi:hypothetical protein